MTSLPEGPPNNPYRENPPTHFAEVHWHGAAFGVLTVTISELSSDDLLSISWITLGPYPGNAPIPRAGWQGRPSAFIRFADSGPIETIEQAPDHPGTGPTTHQYVVVQIPGVPSRGSLPPEGTDSTADYYWGLVNDEWSRLYSANLNKVSEQSGSAAPHYTAFNLSAEWATSGGNIYDNSTSPGINWPNASVGPVAIQYGWTTWASAYPYTGDPMPGISATHLDAYSQLNEFADAVAGIWHVWDLVNEPGIVPGDKLQSYREVYLIDFAQVQKDTGATEIVIAQGWDDAPPPFTGASYRNSYRLQLYNNPDNFMTGPQQTVRVRADAPQSYYDQTKTVAWNDGSKTEHPVLRFTASGWPAPVVGAPPRALEVA